MKKIILTFLSIIYLITVSYAYDNSSPFLLSSFSARNSGMGNATVVNSCGIEAIEANPAGLGEIKDPQIFSTHGELGWGRKYNGIGFSFTRNNLGLGFLWRNFGISSIPITQTDNNNFVGALPDGSLLNNINIIGYTEDKSNLFTFSVSKKVFPKLSLGTNISYFKRTLYTNEADAFLLDIGGKYYYSPKLEFGFLLKNISSNLKWESGQKDQLPSSFSLGISYLFWPTIKAEADLIFRESDDMDLNFGIEGKLKKRIILRSGWNLGKFSAGIGFNLQNWQINYSYTQDDLETIHRISALTTLWDWDLPFKEKKKKQKKKLSHLTQLKKTENIKNSQSPKQEEIITSAGNIPLIYQKIRDNHIYFKLDALKLLGINFKFEEKTQIIKFKKGNIHILAKIGETNILINSKKWVNLNHPVIQEEGNIYLPSEILKNLQIEITKTKDK